MFGKFYYDRLFDFSGPDPGEPYPALAEEWEETERTLKVKLKEGIKYHEGGEVVAQDVVENIARAQDETIGHYLAGPFGKIESAEALDKYTVQLTWDRVYPVKLLDLTKLHIVSPEHMDELPMKPAGGSGPWKLESYEIGDKLISVRNEEYWREGLPYMDEIVHKVIPDAQARLANLMAGQLDQTRGMSLPATKTLMDNPSVQLSSVPEGALWHAAFYNCGKSPFDKSLVRQAMGFTLDREKMAELAFLGLTKGTTTRYPPDSPWYCEEAAEFYSFDLDKAAKLLAEAGYPDGFKVDCMIPSQTCAGHDGMAPIWKEDLAKIGVEIEITDILWSLWVERFIAGDYDIATCCTGDGMLEPATVLTTSSILRDANNFARLEQTPRFEEYSKLKGDLLGTIDRDERKRINDRIQVLMAEEGYQHPFTFWKSYQAFSGRVRDVVMPLDTVLDYATIWLAEG